MPEVRIEAFPRIHIGLISMHEAAPRHNGGAGFSVAGPVAVVTAVDSDHLSVSDNRDHPMGKAELMDLHSSVVALMAECKLGRAASISVSGDMKTHIGMGSGTAIRLAAVECMAILNGVDLPRSALVAASRRGGTSGVGINVYFDGGFLCDLGKSSIEGDFRPSSRVKSVTPPLALPRLVLGQWPLLLVIPRSIIPKTQDEEAAFFEKTAPLPDWASFEASYIALFQLYASAAELDYAAFCRGINDMQYTAWKSAERREYGDALQQISDELHRGGADCVGMSSLGPMLFAFAGSRRCEALAQIALSLDCEVFHTRPMNSGRVVRCSDA